MTRSTLRLNEVKKIVAKLREAQYKVQEFAGAGFSCEVDGTQVFRATFQSDDRYDVRMNREIMLDA